MKQASKFPETLEDELGVAVTAAALVCTSEEIAKTHTVARSSHELRAAALTYEDQIAQSQDTIRDSCPVEVTAASSIISKLPTTDSSAA